MKKVQTWRLLPFQTYDGYTNMAIDEYLLEQVIKKQIPNTLRFYQWSPGTATIGKNQSLSAEIDLNFAKAHGIQVVRRITGGGAVLHAENAEITYSVIADLSAIPPLVETPRVYDPSIPARYIAILESLAQGLEQIGVPIDVGKIHCPALLTHGKKLSGNAQAIRSNVLLQHGTILLDVDPEFMYSILQAPVGVSYTKMIQSVRSKVVGLHSLSNNSEHERFARLAPKLVVEELQKSFAKIFQIQLSLEPLSPAEWVKIGELAENKYASSDWLQKLP